MDARIERDLEALRSYGRRRLLWAELFLIRPHVFGPVVILCTALWIAVALLGPALVGRWATVLLLSAGGAFALAGKRAAARRFVAVLIVTAVVFALGAPGFLAVPGLVSGVLFSWAFLDFINAPNLVRARIEGRSAPATETRVEALN
jgi:hypothetical protein